jgi:hypothetical protein
MSSSTLPADPDAAAAAASSRVLYYLETAVGYNLADVGPALEKVKTLLQQSRRPEFISFCSS